MAKSLQHVSGIHAAFYNFDGDLFLIVRVIAGSQEDFSHASPAE
jgi:hypothetical protein